MWLSADPLSGYNPVFEVEHYIDGQHNGGVFNSGNHNTYGYTYQNPIRYIDPNGKQILAPTIGGSIIGSSVTGSSIGIGTAIATATIISRTPIIINPNIQKTIKLDFAKRDRVKYQNDLEKSSDQLEGIKRAQNNNKKDAPKGEKQNKIQSIRKSEQGFGYRLKRIDIKDLDNLDTIISMPPVKIDNLRIERGVSPSELRGIDRKATEKKYKEHIKQLIADGKIS